MYKTVTTSITLFQFHKVRLKGIGTKALAEDDMFQFHKVRLKAGLRVFPKSCLMFQFHKVRLKGVYLGSVRADSRCFNSIRYD